MLKEGRRLICTGSIKTSISWAPLSARLRLPEETHDVHTSYRTIPGRTGGQFLVGRRGAIESASQAGQPESLRKIVFQTNDIEMAVTVFAKFAEFVVVLVATNSTEQPSRNQ